VEAAGYTCPAGRPCSRSAEAGARGAEEEGEGLGLSQDCGFHPMETGAFAMPDKPMSPLRQRTIDDMTARRVKEKVRWPLLAQGLV